MTKPADTCPHGQSLNSNKGICASCWLQVGLDPTHLPAPTEIGSYRILTELGHGAHGIVYDAVQQVGNLRVALKVISSEDSTREIAHLVRLKHRNIVRIFDSSGLLSDPPFFAMQLLEGGTLRDRLNDPDQATRLRSPRQAIRLMVPIAEAIQHAHGCSVLHRDLKPSNVLFDTHNEPHVSDFSVAKLIDGAEPNVHSTLVGTCPYMSPEQAGAIDEPVTTASDIYGLGALLYELLSGHPPRSANNLEELRESFARTASPTALKLPGGWRDLAAVCTKALSQAPETRYRSAAHFAEDLIRVQSGEELPWHTRSLWQQLRHSTLRRPRLAALILVGGIFVSAINWVTFDSLRDHESRLIQHVLRSNAVLAKAQAIAVLAEFEKRRVELKRLALDSSTELEEVLANQIHGRMNLALNADGFDSLFLADCNGVTREHFFYESQTKSWSPGPAGYFLSSYTFRDYFQGAMQLARDSTVDVYVGRAIRSTWDGQIRIAFSTPVYGTGGGASPCRAGSGAVGVLLGTIGASSLLSRLQLSDTIGSGQRTALFGLRDRDRALDTLSTTSTYYALVHDSLRSDEARALDPAFARRLAKHFGALTVPGHQFEMANGDALMDDGYIPAFDEPNARSNGSPYENPWTMLGDGARSLIALFTRSETHALGGFFPVGQSGFIIGVETAYSRAAALGQGVYVLTIVNLAYLGLILAMMWRRLHDATPR